MAALKKRPLSWVGPFLVLLIGASCLVLAASANESSFATELELPGMRLANYAHGMDDCGDFSEVRKDGGAASDHLNKTTRMMRVSMKHRTEHHLHRSASRMELFSQSLARDSSRLHSIHGRSIKFDESLAESSHLVQDATPSPAPSPLFVPPKDSPPPFQPPASAPAPMATSTSTTPITYNFKSTVESGVTLGSGEYFIDVSIGTPPRHFSLIIDTGSDLTWVQCIPCQHCYDQEGPKFNPSNSSSYKPIACSDPECQLVSPATHEACAPQKPRGCSYFYWYGDKSNTTGDLATETVTLSGSDGKPLHIGNVVFGCGHANEGLFCGAGGLLGLGKGPLSFTSQLRELYGRTFSYCLVDRDSDLSVSSILTFGEDKVLSTHPDLQFTSFAKNTSTETFYYVEIDKVSVGGRDVPIPPTVWKINPDMSGGIIVDSGTTLTYFANPAYEAIRQSFEAQISYPAAESDLLSLCYNVSGVSNVQFPDFAITFKDGAVLKPPSSNYFIQLDGERHISCLAILGTPSSTLSILGNFLQQNIHIMYDIPNSRLGFAPMVCSSLSS